MKHLGPAAYIVHVFGGVRATARAVGRDPSNVSKWTKRKRIPTAIQRHILSIAKRRGLDVKAADLVLGRKVRSTAK